MVSIGVSPAKTEYWIRNQFGAVGGAAIGKLPNNPMVRQEQHHITQGRAYTYFYDDKSNSTQEYNSLKFKDYTPEEKTGVIEDYVLHNKMSDVLSNIRRTIKINKDIPESIKQQSFELLVRINNGEGGDSIYKEIAQLNKNICNYIHENKIDIGREYNVTVESINESINEYKYKNE